VGNVLLDMAVSLDGFVAGPNGEDGGLHNYFFSPSTESAAIIEEGFRITGAIIMGRRSYETGASQDGFADNPYQVPTFVLSHHVPQKKARGAESFVFVTDGIESAVRQARAAVGDRDVVIGGGANTAQQFMSAGLVDEIQLHLVHVLLGDGLRLFGDSSSAPVQMERTRVVDAPGVTHLKFRVVK
jgi:dihydrofolate reductase